MLQFPSQMYPKISEIRLKATELQQKDNKIDQNNQNYSQNGNEGNGFASDGFSLDQFCSDENNHNIYKESGFKNFIFETMKSHANFESNG